MARTSFLPLAALAALSLVAAPCRLHAQSALPRAPLTVTPDWLAEHLRDPKLVLLQVGDRHEYDKEHIAGARYVSLRDISVSNHDMQRDTGLMLEMPTPDSLRQQLAALGISDDSRVVVYYNGNDWVSSATRVMFTLDYAGLGRNSVLLDGGMKAWKETGHAITAQPAPAVVGRLSALRIRPIVVDAAFVRANIGSRTIHIVDGRDAVYYDGIEATGPRKGHVPGARNIPFTSVTDDNLHLKSAPELTAIFDRAGIEPGDTVLAYCHIGMQATAVLFAARSLGHPVLLYDGSFQEWSRRTDLPIENPSGGRLK
jgi:thiosulfate/3-mercaptopyruvate sulfurtransferase